MNFSMDERVIYSAKNSQEKAERLVSGLREICQDPRLKGLLTQEDTRELNETFDVLSLHAKSKIKIAVTGSFKRGKSSLLNALLGENVVPTDVTPETITVNYVEYRENNGIEAVLTNGMRLEFKDEEITRDRLEEIQRELPAPIDHLEIFRNLPVLEELSFIDTPGLGDVDIDYRETITRALLQSDIVIYVVSAQSPLSADEQIFLNSIVYPENFSKMFVLINMADTLESSEDAERVKEHVARQIYAANPNATVGIISTLDEYCRKRGMKRPSPEMGQYLEEHFQSFSNALTDDVLTQKEMIRETRLATMKQRAIKMVRKKIESILAVADMDEEKMQSAEQRLLEEKLNLDQTLSETTAAVIGFVKDKKDEAHVWIGEFLRRMKEELEKVQAEAKGQEIQKHLSFYISDKTKEAFIACLNAHAVQMNEMLKEELGNAQTHFLQERGDYDGAFVRLRDISWTNVDAAVFFGEYISSMFGAGIGTLGSLVFNAGAGALRQHKVGKSQKDIIAPILDDFASISKQVNTQLDETYDTYAGNSVEEVENYFRKSIDDSLEMIRQAQEKSSEFAQRRESIHEDMETLLEALEQLEKAV